MPVLMPAATWGSEDVEKQVKKFAKDASSLTTGTLDPERLPNLFLDTEGIVDDAVTVQKMASYQENRVDVGIDQDAFPSAIPLVVEASLTAPSWADEAVYRVEATVCGYNDQGSDGSMLARVKVDSDPARHSSRMQTVPDDSFGSVYATIVDTVVDPVGEVTGLVEVTAGTGWSNSDPSNMAVGAGAVKVVLTGIYTKLED